MLHAFAIDTEPPNAWVNPAGFAGDHPGQAWREAREACLAQLTPAKFDRTFMYEGYQDTVGRFVTTITFDLLGHTWDLAQASGQHVVLPADLVEEMLAWGRAGDAILRRPGFLGPALAAPDGADVQSQFIALLGRAEPEAPAAPPRGVCRIDVRKVHIRDTATAGERTGWPRPRYVA